MNPYASTRVLAFLSLTFAAALGAACVTDGQRGADRAFASIGPQPIEPRLEMEAGVDASSSSSLPDGAVDAIDAFVPPIEADAGLDAAALSDSAVRQSPERPNIVVILLDDLGYSDLGSYGSEIRTPNIDQLAQGGTRFRNYHVTPRCSPTRMSLLTGQYTQQVATQPGHALPPLRSDNNVTVPELLSAAGYRTYMAGKWHLGADDDQLPRARGFDHVFGFGADGAGPGASKWDKTRYGLQSKDQAIAPREYGDKPGDFYQTRAIADYALDYLTHHEAQNDGAPFFMYLSFPAPHYPIQVSRDVAERVPEGGRSYLDIYSAGWDKVRVERYERMLAMGVVDERYALSPRDAYTQANVSIPDWTSLSEEQQADLARKMALYAGSVEEVDEAVGRVIARLEATGQLDNTLIVVQSDNGGNYEGGVFGSAFGQPDPLTGEQLLNMGQPGQEDGVKVGGGWAIVQNTPFRLFKHYTHGGGVRSPLVVSWPARTQRPGAFSNQVSHVIDLAPTILEAAQVPHPTRFEGRRVLPLEGRSLLPAIADADEAEPRTLGFEHEINRAWIDGDFKLVVRHETGGVAELYDLATDPSEVHDLASALPERLAQMVSAWNAWATRVGVPRSRLMQIAE